ncbi:N-acetylglucosamine-6-phosphate deacetylase [Leifsonia sp. 21MFCrub1.1]|uniref:N-acetylglucosamine-6-phosphate deacetylase n=1 Tax=Leifsonia sp. 21MFCrub1.1 TaxID=1798223 RepID=UPI00089291D8|nr:N-acetylglucosamine-6-phosphate deacetylase [Leifsonia sp. 21MFCrub1.1]SEA58603.1 N-acetylglucosamine 6-phosphate deacetylase [Leifsonia sp. 21MFCrub1.1]
MSGLVIHSARKLDAEGLVDDFWLVAEGAHITATGTGAGWREAVRSGTDDDAAGLDPSSTDVQVIDAHGHWLTPGFIDLHCHGGGGHPYDDGVDQMRAALATHRAHGTTRSLVSHVANPLASLRESLAVVAELTASDPLVLGSHLEGPFLAAERRGAHDARFLRDPEPEAVEELIAAARGTLRTATIAPELPNALEAIGVLIEADVVVGVGHTAAGYAQTARAFEVGARLLSHAFNAMPGIHHRAPGPVMAAIDHPEVTLELILDGLHVAPTVGALLFREAPGRVALVTDAMAAAGATDGDYRLGGLNVTVHDGLAVLSGTDTIAGSTLTQDVALRNAVTLAGLDPVVAVAALTRTPARVLGEGHRLGRLHAGYVADAVLLDHDWNVTAVVADGAPLPR